MLRRFLRRGDDQSLLSAERLLILAVVAILVVLAINQYASLMARDRDNQRKADLLTLQLAVQKYFALNGKYPLSLGQLGNVPSGACQDPSGGGNCQSPDYIYQAYSPGTKPAVGVNSNCNNTSVNCINYLLASDRMETTINPYVLTND